MLVDWSAGRSGGSALFLQFASLLLPHFVSYAASHCNEAIHIFSLSSFFPVWVNSNKNNICGCVSMAARRAGGSVEFWSVMADADSCINI